MFVALKEIDECSAKRIGRGVREKHLTAVGGFLSPAPIPKIQQRRRNLPEQRHINTLHFPAAIEVTWALFRRDERRASFVSVPDLEAAIEEFMQAWNQNPKPFIWTASVGEIIQKIERALGGLGRVR
jgi:hypothetical protein